jgi:chemosensory pili system protein ChpA (sensor histidine kinase/response regulator)
METLRSNLEISRLHMDSREPLVTMRRGFHTLKGSGRMVGLTELGEVAWAVERAMNKWLQENKPATPVLLDMIGDAEVLFQHWVDMLRSGSTSATIDTAYLLTVADCVENDKEIPQPKFKVEHHVPELAAEALEVEPRVPEFAAEALEIKPRVPEPAAELVEVVAPVQEAEEAEEGTIQIGSVSLSTMLFNIATEEAAGHVHALHEQLAVLHETEAHLVTYDFMRAAHTLAGVNRTMGFVQIAELAYALELWLEERIDKPHTVSEQQMPLIDQVVQRLEELCAMVREQRQEPPAQPELITRLQADRGISAGEAAPRAPALELELPAISEFQLPVIPELELPAAPVEKAAVAEFIPEITLDFSLPSEAAPAAPSPAPVPQKATTDEEEPKPQPAKRERTVHDEIDEQLLPIFLEEAHELYPQIGSTLRAWREQPGDAQLGRNLQRSLHTLKGSARMAGAMRLGELTHRVEDRVDKAVAGGEFSAELWGELDNYLDRIGNAIEQLQRPQAAPTAAEPAAASTVQQQFETTQIIAPQALEVGAERAMQAALLRVRSDTVDRLVNEAGEVSVARSRAETELREFKNSVLDLTDSVNRLRKQLREIEIHAEGQMQARISVSGESAEKFDPLEFDRFTRFQELTRFMNESVHDVQTVQQALLKNLAETEAALTAQAHLNRDLQQGLMAIRMVPFASISERLYRIVRQTGKELSKRANLELSGTEVELDRSVLEKMTAPFEHLLRNSIAHGLETPEQRERAHKPPIGEIRLSLRQESNEVVFEFSDDGAGLDIARIRQKAVEKGVLQADEEPSDEQVMQLVFTSGISTAEEVTEISGRGVGMDVVRSEITALGGRIDVSSESGRGVRFTIHLPLTLAVTKVLLVRAGQHTYALPSTMIENVQQLKPAELEAAYQQQYVDWQGARYPLHHLARLAGDDEAEVVSLPHNPVLLLRSGDSRIAVHVDELHGNHEVVVKNIGPQLARLPGIAGATVSGSGTVILILNPIAFTQRIVVTRKAAKAAAVVEEVRKVPVVMVVDDSLTVRKITGRLLARSGYQVMTAKDGVDALEQLTDVLPDVMLLDVEMPRMDGFELTKRLRQDSRTKDLPIIMITSRTADKHRHYALELGVNGYLGKPYQEEELLENIARFVTL